MGSATVPRRVRMTVQALELLRQLANAHGELMIHQSGGCCDGSAPMCYPRGEFIVGGQDVLLGVLDLCLNVGEVSPRLPHGVDAVPVWISVPQFEAWKHTQMILDVVPGRGSGFSLEAPGGMRFLSRARAFTPAENGLLASTAVFSGTDWRSGWAYQNAYEPQVTADAAEACCVPNYTRA